MVDDMVMRSVYLWPKQDSQLRQLAHELNVSKSDLIRSAISIKLRDWLESNDDNERVLHDLTFGRRESAVLVGTKARARSAGPRKLARSTQRDDPSPAKVTDAAAAPRHTVRRTFQIGDVAPDFEAETTQGRIRFHDWIGDSWCVLFTHPKDFMPVSTTEVGYMAKIAPEFARRGVKIIGLSVDSVQDHAKWSKDIEETQGAAPNYPMIGDPDLKISKLYGMLPASASGDASARTPADNQTVRNVFVIGPDKKIKLVIIYPITTGRNFDVVLRVIDSLQLTAKHRVATPVNWRPGEDVVIAGSVSDEEAANTSASDGEGRARTRPGRRIYPH